MILKYNLDIQYIDKRQRKDKDKQTWKKKILG